MEVITILINVQRGIEGDNIYNVQVVTKGEYVARKIPQIHAALDNRKPYHQPSMIEIEGKIVQVPISILID